MIHSHSSKFFRLHLTCSFWRTREVMEIGCYLRALLQPHGVRVSIALPGFIDSGITRENQFFMPFKVSAPEGARRIREDVDRRPGIVGFPWVLWAVCLWFRMLPLFIQHFLRTKAVAMMGSPSSPRASPADPDNNNKNSEAADAKRD
jgi:hypothetical protein